MEQTQSVASDHEIVFGRQESKYRLLKEYFLSPEECQKLVELIDAYAEVGDGYGGNPHPHTPTETFGGYSLDGLNNEKQQDIPGHREALATVLKVRKLLKSHFGLPFLWLDYAHLLFRVQTAGTEDEPVEYSHPWHFDNQSEGVKHRTHTAIIYLNDAFTGGHTCFQEADFGPYRQVAPSPGTLLGFDAAKNGHAVTKLTGGKRYTMIMWFSTHWRIFPRHRKIFMPL
jgi:hypothetical protein